MILQLNSYNYGILNKFTTLYYSKMLRFSVLLLALPRNYKPNLNAQALINFIQMPQMLLRIETLLNFRL